MPLILLWLTNAIIATPVLLYVRYDFLVPAREHLLNFNRSADIKSLGTTVLVFVLLYSHYSFLVPVREHLLNFD